MSEQKEVTGFSLKVGKLAKTIMDIDNECFTTDFEANKKLVKKFLPTISKQIQNKVAGYIVRLSKDEKE
jgi:ribosomal protein S17E